MSVHKEIVNELWFIHTVEYHAAVEKMNSIYNIKRSATEWIKARYRTVHAKWSCLNKKNAFVNIHTLM